MEARKDCKYSVGTSSGTEDEKILYKHLKAIGCCKRCILRYLGSNKHFISFEAPETSLANLDLLSPFDEMGGPECKKMKENPCSVCVGLLQDDVLAEMFAYSGLAGVAKLNSDEFELFITFPACALIRDHSVKVYLKQHCPDIFKEENVVQIRKAWKFTVETKISQILSKTFRGQASLAVHFYTNYILDAEETDVFRRGLKEAEPFSRHRLLKILETISDKDFKKIISVPPNIPLYEVKLNDFDYYTDSIFLMGFLNKYTRDSLMVRTPKGPICDKPTIQELILNAAHAVIKRKFGTFQFHASTFDDPSFRILGTGKMFTIQIGQPSFSSLSLKSIKKIQHLVNQSPDFRIKNLQIASRNYASQLVEAEAAKPKSLKALILVSKCTRIDHCVNAINMYKIIKVNQATPLRMMTYRGLERKVRTIYKIKASKVSENLLVVDLCVEQGLQVPEFIHGDFGRTKPSLCEILRRKADVLAIDILESKMYVHEEDEET